MERQFVYNQLIMGNVQVRTMKNIFKGKNNETKPPKKKENAQLFSPKHEMQKMKEQQRVDGLHNVIKQEINAAGGAPMSLARFMELALMHPKFGYYSTKEKIFNKGGDFTTSPEISQMFGEMIGVWLMTALNNYKDDSDQSLIENK